MRGDHLQAFGNAEAGCICGDEESGKATRPRRFAGAREDRVDVRDTTVGDPGLLAVEHISVAVAGSRKVHVGNIGTRTGLAESEGGDGAARARFREPATALRWRAEKRDRAGPEALHCEGKVGKAVVTRERLADEAKGANVELRKGLGRIECSMREPPVAAEHRNECAARGVGVGVVDFPEICGGPRFKVLGERAVAVLEEWPVEEALVRHQLPSKTGFALATKAS